MQHHLPCDGTAELPKPAEQPAQQQATLKAAPAQVSLTPAGILVVGTPAQLRRMATYLQDAELALTEKSSRIDRRNERAAEHSRDLMRQAREAKSMADAIRKLIPEPLRDGSDCAHAGHGGVA